MFLRRTEIELNFLYSRLINVTFHICLSIISLYIICNTIITFTFTDELMYFVSKKYNIQQNLNDPIEIHTETSHNISHE